VLPRRADNLDFYRADLLLAGLGGTAGILLGLAATAGYAVAPQSPPPSSGTAIGAGLGTALGQC
jgi:hypothetical protein